MTTLIDVMKTILGVLVLSLAVIAGGLFILIALTVVNPLFWVAVAVYFIF